MAGKRRDNLPTPDARPALPWDQRTDESPWDYCLFWNYVQLEGRSCDKLAGTMVQFNGKPKKVPGGRRLRELSRTYEWVRRSGLWDSHWLEVGVRKVMADRNADQEKAAKSHTEAGRALQEAGLRPLQARIRRLRRLGELHNKALAKQDWREAEKLEALMAEEATMSEAARVVKDGVTMERLGLGMPTSSTGIDARVSGSVAHHVDGAVNVSGTVQHTVSLRAALSVLSDEQLEQLDSFARTIEEAGVRSLPMDN